MYMIPKISIITVVYNAKGFLEETIESVLSQNFNNFEYIIIDGGSIDGTLDIIKKYQDRITLWVSEPDKGIYDAMNKGIRYAKGEYVYFLGGDDLLFDNQVLKNVNSYLMDKRKVDVSIKTFVRSLVNILLTILLIISVVGALGVETTSFAALLASAGVAVGMALSGNLQNFAGGLVILLFKPYKVGDWIETQQGSAGTVKEIQIFHTILTTGDNKLIYIPNGSLSSGVVINYSHQETRRVEWIIGIDYGEDYNKVQQIVRDILAEDKRILNEPAPFIALHALDASSVNVVVRVWVNSGDYWGVYFDTNKAIYETFNEKGINFPFPQLTVHQGN